jgi:2-polyprenyl-6-methoxyphenol hydroxylase-like FAD-dependent oxidoreductase
MTTGKCVLISGASLAGLTTAYWLQQYGFSVTVVERAPALRMGGNGVDVQDQALQVAERMHIMPQIRDRALDVQGMLFINDKGRNVAKIDLQSIQRKYNPGQTEIMRGDLIGILYGLIKDKVEVLFNDTITTIDQDDTSAHIAFQRSKPRVFDIVIGADGIHSNVRKLVFGPEKQFTRYLGYYGGFADVPSDWSEDLSENRWMTIYNEPGRMAGVSRPGSHIQAKCYFLFEQPTQLSYDYHDLDEQKKILRNGMAGMGWRVADIVEKAAADPELYFDSLSQIRMPSWSSGRVTLVGDAAYCASPVTGAGALLALVGGYRLAGELKAAGGDYTIGYGNYEAGMRPLVARKQSQTFNGLLAPKSRVGISMRNLLARVPILGLLSGFEQRFGAKQEDLPVY